ncbi:MAG: imidazole glycerol phosphate synthase subunit HisH [Actinomycetota bacterium]
MYIAIINYNMGNIRSVENAFKIIGAKVKVTSDIDIISKSSALVLPGVGAFRDAMENLGSLGLIDIIRDSVARKPFLGICLGYQLLFEASAEDGKNVGLGLFKGIVEKIPPIVKVPHMGWNQVRVIKQDSTIFKGIEDKQYFYFVHSYHAVAADKAIISSITDHGIEIAAGIERGYTFAFQFHPEKSSQHGLKLLKNFWNITKRGGHDCHTSN